MGSKLDEWIVEASIGMMQQAMEEGRLSSEELVSQYLERIERYDHSLKSVIEVNPEALDIARALDSERKGRGSRGGLHGIPVLLKDNMGTNDKTRTSAGALALACSIPKEDSFVASQLRDAGAVLLGKANMTEWANFMSSTMPAGYSSRGGQTLNPYGPGEIFVGGSSSGSAAAVAANLAAAAIGTETSGSIISPASQNCIVGIKPTVGLISRYGIIPLTETQDTPGPMARTVADAALLLGALTARDRRDASTCKKHRLAFSDYTPFLDRNFLARARIGIPRHYYQHLDDESLALLEHAIQVLRSEGATVIDPVELPCQGEEWDAYVLQFEFKKYLNDYLRTLPESVPVRTLEDVIRFNEQHPETALKYGQDVLLWSNQTSGTLTEQVYLNSKRRNFELAGRQGIDAALERYRLDALLILGDDDMNDLAARAGYPSITVPGGFVAEGTITEEGHSTKGPHGITFVGTAFSEPTLIRLAYGFEQATQHRVPPNL
ncbi:amidase family protein [Paenibacillus ihumii]|uniref:amidase family protein n=1 Tax=Paenibacillus ihumii TaxID=687436 RepID=UPI0006D7CC16|nr:amidase family protein [Paenibacillus ihumii]